MDNNFKIQFHVPIEALEKTIILNARVSLHHSVPHYKVSNINLPESQENLPPLLADIDIQCIDSDGVLTWVHVDSGKSSILSLSVGHAIEQKLNSAVQVVNKGAENQNADLC